MNIIFFFIFAFLTVFLSIKISVLADSLSNTSKVSKVLIGGILLAGVTALPEFVTCLSAIVFKNPHLAVGDVLGSNLFNIFIISFFDIIFIRKMMFNKTKSSNFFIFVLLIVSYIFILFFGNGNLSLLNIGIPTFIIIGCYIIYLFLIKKRNVLEKEESRFSYHKGIILKLVICSLFLIVSSVLLTITVNNISNYYVHFSSSLIGAILLGITTSLPEVITFYTLVMLDNYDLALLNIIGSNLFNLLVLALGDFILVGNPIYKYSDKETLIMVFLGIIVTVIAFIQNLKSKSFNKFTYIIPSIVIVLLYLAFWFLNFVY